MGRGGSRVLQRIIETLLWGLGALLLGWCAFAYVETRLYQAREERVLDEIPRAAVSAPETASFGSWPQAIDVDPGLVGRIEIPRLGVRAIVREGIDSKTLRLAVGHVPGTALPSEQGNVCLAGHRDTFFRKLANVRRNDWIRMKTPRGEYVYRVERISIVTPDALRVLAATTDPTLTLVTCYPFNFVGSAPKRFIVTARRTESS
jgi:sortase A